TGPRISQTNRLHRTETKRVNSATRQLLNRQTGFKPSCFFKSLKRNALGVDQTGIESQVLLFVKRAVQIIVATFVVSRGGKGDRLIYGLRGDDGRDCIIKIELIASGYLHDFLSKSVGG